MAIPIRLAAYLLGFAAFSLTGHFTGCLLVAAGCALTLVLLRRNRHILGYAGLGLLSALHATSWDLLALMIISGGLLLLETDTKNSSGRRLGLVLAGGVTLAGIATGQATLLLCGLGCILIAANINVPEKVRTWTTALLLGAYGCLLLPSPYLRTGQSVYLEQGKWAMDSGDYGNHGKGLNLRNETTYSYTWMIRLIADRKGNVLSLGPADATAWLVTPTRPMTAEETKHLQAWVHGGGRLVVIADHTDYVGHARCLNQLTKPMGLTVGIGAFLPEVDQAESSQSLLGNDALTKTPTVATATGAIPLLTARGYFEAPDYSKPGFFGPCTPSYDDSYGRQMTGGSVRHGLGSLVFWGDSTLFSNFSIFQPDSIQTLALLNSRAWALLPAYAVFLLGALLLLRMFLAAFAIPLALMLTLGWVGPDSNKLVSKHPNTAWAGDKNLVDDKFDPKASFSTLYALSSATGKIPRWTDHPEIETGGIWVSEQPPPPGDWRWLSPFLSVKHTTTDPRNPWDKLVRFVNSEARYTTSAGVADPKKCDAGGLWTNEGLGSWWFGMGTAPARIEKISSGLDWLSSGKTSWGEPPYAQVRGLPEPCTVMTDGGKRLELELPRANAEVGSYVYLGAGVSALVTKLDGKIVLTGARDKDCFGYANSMKQSSWVLIYKDDLSAPKR